MTAIDIGECGICGNTLKFSENHAITVCKHLFCVPCLLKWHAHCIKPTCPMCREILYESDESDDESDESDEPDDETDDESDELETIHFDSCETVVQLDFDLHEVVMHEHMMGIIEIQALRHCSYIETQRVFMGTIDMHVVPNYYYERIEVGATTPNSNYIIGLFPTSNMANEHRFRFGRIEEIQLDLMCHALKWYAFRERVSIVDDDRGKMTTNWSNEIKRIKIDDVALLVQYIPRICG